MNWSTKIFFVVAMAAAVLRAAGDGELVARLRRRDPDALGELYDRYGRLIYSLILRIVANQAIAEELVQESFLRVWNRSEGFQEERGSLGPWVLTVARNQALDYVRSLEGRSAKRSVSVDDTEPPVAMNAAEERILDGIQLKKVRVAMQRLNANHRLVIEMAYFEGLSQTEMAERISQPLGTIKTWTRMALKSLREELGAVAS
ncbi:MAG: sigma-70 family RNA polymerase sigma factor [Bryobacteraceae bacterium]